MNLPSVFRISVRNIGRNKRRSTLSMLAVAFAAAVLVFFISLQLSAYSASINATLAMFHGNLQLQHPDYLQKPQIRRGFRGADPLARELEAMPAVQAAAPRGAAFALLSAGKRSIGAQVLGVDPAKEPRVSAIPSLVSRGQFLKQTSGYEAVLGAILARNLGVSPGAEFSMLGQGKDGSLAAGVFRVAGIFESGSSDLDAALVQIPLPVFREVFSMEADEVQMIVVRAKRLEETGRIAERIGPQAGNYGAVARSWQELLPGLEQSIKLDMAVGWLFYLSLVTIVSFTVTSTFLMAVLERTREFGIMLAVGMRKTSLVGLIYLECFILTAAGSLAGVFIGALIVLYFGSVGFSIPGTEEILKRWNLPSAVYPSLSPASLTLGPAVIIAAALVSLAYPAAKLRRLTAVEAMKHA